jgi:SWIM/SEC-C metal-binding protein
MAKLGTKDHPIIVRVKTEERGQYIAEECALRGWQYIIGFEPDKPEDISDFEKAINPPKPVLSDKIGRNDPCPCGSGKKFKKCCGGTDATQPQGTALRYNPEVHPDPGMWLALGEMERRSVIEDYHRAAHITLPNATAHAVIHAVVENQIAEGLDPVLRAMRRLVTGGLTRHEAVHAIGSVVAEHIFEAMNAVSPDTETMQAIYIAAVERLTAKDWRQS